MRARPFHTTAASPSPTKNPGLVTISTWRQHPWLNAAFSTRLGGGSLVYGQGDLNLGLTASDDASTVLSNRERFLRAVGGDRGSQLITLRQFHSNLIRSVDASRTSRTLREHKGVFRGDGLITSEKGLTLGILTADCVPVLLADVRQRVVGAFHAGWRGTAQRIVQCGVGDFVSSYGSATKDIIAAIGPCIGPCCFRVGEEVRSAFETQFGYASELFTEERGVDAQPENAASSYLNLMEANRRQLKEAGVPEANINIVGECTACTRTETGRRKYFSHRADHGFTGRMMSVIGIAAP